MSTDLKSRSFIADRTNGLPRPIRLAYLVSHPIQYQAPLLRRIAALPDVDLTVFFQSDLSVRGSFDPGFGRAVQWDVPLLDGYRHEFLPALGSRDSVEGWRPLSYGIARRLWAGRFDCLWVHGYARWFNWATILAANAAGVRVLVRDEAHGKSKDRSTFKASLKRAAIFRALRAACDGFLAIGTANRDYYVDSGIDPKRVFMVPYCVDNDYFRERAAAARRNRERLRGELKLTPGRPIILYASKLQKRKRAGDLLRAFERMVAGAAEPSSYLLFVGDGEMMEELKATAAPLGDAVRFLGFRNQSELPALFDLCDVFVLPSEREPWGLIVNEAMNAGRAVIVTDQVGCALDLVREGENGHVCPVGDIAALTEALKDVLRSPERIAAMGRASSEIISRWNFDDDIAGLRAALSAVTRRRTAGDRR
ncbi:MAG: glycosyltransferase family 4 protein [Gemmatimonas sp.]